MVPVSPASGQECYDAELLAFLAAMKSDGSSVEFPLEHELLVQARDSTTNHRRAGVRG